MSKDPVRHCPHCGQALRFPENVGGVLMACPECGHRFASPFRLAGTVAAPQAPPAPLAPPVLLADSQQSVAPPPAKKPVASNTLAARVAALYASKS
jgi:uncharacterized Zn finger protein (UPF0148 family)